MPWPFYLVDAFVGGSGQRGNPAGVVLLDGPQPESWMQEVANEVNQAETAFLLTTPGAMSIRWFTPTVEINLCGHATLAAATALSDFTGEKGGRLDLECKSGRISVEPAGNDYRLDFPANPANECEVPPGLRPLLEGCQWFGASSRQDYLAVLPTAEHVMSFVPDVAAIEASGPRGLIVTAAHGEGAFAMRFFAPQLGVPEDHATGSVQTVAAPYWAAQFGTAQVMCLQLSPRGAVLKNTLADDRVLIAGRTRIRVSGSLVN